jgi:hypothetical protein
VQRIVGVILLIFLAIAIGGNISSNVYGSSHLSNGIANQQKVVILTYLLSDPKRVYRYHSPFTITVPFIQLGCRTQSKDKHPQPLARVDMASHIQGSPNASYLILQSHYILCLWQN